MKKVLLTWLVKIGIGLLIVALVGGGGFGLATYLQQKNSQTKPTPEITSSKEAVFIAETYQVLADNYWEKLTDEQLSELFFKALSRSYGPQGEIEEKNLKSVTGLVDSLVKNQPNLDHSDLLAQALDLVLQNLKPFGRSRLYLEQDTKALEERVSNIDPKTDLFATLGTTQTASDTAIAQAYDQKKQEINKTATDEAEKALKLAEVDRAYQAVGDQESRNRYAQTGIEPTISGKNLGEGIFYVKIKQFSPTTVQDLASILQKMPTQELGSSLIIDLRDNFGGAIDGLPYFLGPFIGNNQYAYQFFSKGKTTDFKTKVDKLKELENFKKVIVLINENTQSSAEVMAGVLKKYNTGVLVGSKTKGWGTVERVFPLKSTLSADKKFSLFLVHSLTLDDTGKPIEENGIMPDIDTTQNNWQTKLGAYFFDGALNTQVAKLINEK